ncbi:MAG: hypothetical protein WDZ77_01855 [Candidatus Pacearchaeota archaeon]
MDEKAEDLRKEYFQRSMQFKQKIEEAFETPGLGYLKERTQRSLLGLPILEREKLYAGRGNNCIALRLGFTHSYKKPLLIRLQTPIDSRYSEKLEFYAQKAERLYEEGKIVPEFCVGVRILNSKYDGKEHGYGLITEDMTDFGRFSLEEVDTRSQDYWRTNKQTKKREKIYLDLGLENSQNSGRLSDLSTDYFALGNFIDLDLPENLRQELLSREERYKKQDEEIAKLIKEEKDLRKRLKK